MGNFMMIEVIFLKVISSNIGVFFWGGEQEEGIFVKGTKLTIIVIGQAVCIGLLEECYSLLGELRETSDDD
jgi:hypothetical protein